MAVGEGSGVGSGPGVGSLPFLLVLLSLEFAEASPLSDELEGGPFFAQPAAGSAIANTISASPKYFVLCLESPTNAPNLESPRLRVNYLSILIKYGRTEP